jgi:glycerol uptake facilitator-like aquaporin/protein-tyrosine-phosphatase
MHYSVLSLCTGNSARSIMAEAIMNFKGRPNFSSYSAGSHPAGTIRPEAIAQLESARLPTEGLSSKSWEEFAKPDAPKLGFVFTVCDNAAKEVCPIWPGQPLTAHWGVPDPAAVTGTPEEIERAYRSAFMTLERRIGLFLSLPIAAIDKLAIQREIPKHRTPMNLDLPVRLTAEFLGTAFLVAAIIGSGIMGERLSGGNVAIALLANTIATGAALVALILTFGPLSGAHLNPAVTLADAIEHGITWQEALGYIAAQCAGGLSGAVVAHLMLELPTYSFSTHPRNGPSQVLSEFVATFGLLAVIRGCSRRTPSAVPYAVSSYITAAYWFTASTSFANPAVTIARAFSDTFAGIRPKDAPLFIAAQLAGALAATILFRWLVPRPEQHPR